MLKIAWRKGENSWISCGWVSALIAFLNQCHRLLMAVQQRTSEVTEVRLPVRQLIMAHFQAKGRLLWTQPCVFPALTPGSVSALRRHHQGHFRSVGFDLSWNYCKSFRQILFFTAHVAVLICNGNSTACEASLKKRLLKGNIQYFLCFFQASKASYWCLMNVEQLCWCLGASGHLKGQRHSFHRSVCDKSSLPLK